MLMAMLIFALGMFMAMLELPPPPIRLPVELPVPYKREEK
jgi:hypothetical protein